MTSYPRVGYVYDNQMGGHQHSDFHWERPERIYSINTTVNKAELNMLLYNVKSRKASTEELRLAHSQEYIQAITRQLQGSNPGNISLTDQDMYANKKTLNSALLATGSCLNLLEEILENRMDSGFANVRPPGHHASPEKCNGFCFFNNVVISAINAAMRGKRVLIVDWDVHFGDGSISILNSLHKINPELADKIFFFSIHRWDNGKFYPGTGKSYTKNRSISIGFNGPQGDKYYINQFKNILTPIATEFKPDLILVSAGFDAAMGDPLGGSHVTPEGYYTLSKILQDICPKIMMVLEGGYNLKSISNSAVACLQALLHLPLKIPKIDLEYPEMKMV